MTVSIIIVNWNGGDILAKCLHHLDLQTVKPDRVFVVDNASSDHSADSVDAFPGVTLMRMSENLGFAAGNNIALSECNTDFVVFLNPDAFADTRWLEFLLLAAASRPDVAAFGCRQMRYGASGILDGTGDRYLMTGQVRRDRYGEALESIDLQSHEIFSACAAAAMYRRESLLVCGGFDEDFFCYVEDVDLGFRLRINGYKSIYVPDAIVEHVGSATTGGQHSEFATYHGHRNLVWVFVKNVPGWLFWVLLPLHILLNIVSAFVLALQGRGKVMFRAKRDAILGLPKMWKKRQLIQKNRRSSVAEIWKQMDRSIVLSKSSLKN